MIESTDKKNVRSVNKQSIALWASVVLVLLIPLVAMQFSDEVNWDFMDFMVAGALLTFAVLAYELASRKLVNSKYRLAVGIAILAALVLVWVELAVGLF